MTIEYVNRKKLAAVALRGSIRTIALGSSHSDCGFDPKYFPESFNLSTASQDLYGGLYIYKWALKNLPNLRRIILFYSLFTAGFDAANSSERGHAEAYRIVFASDDTEPPANDEAILADTEENEFRGYLAFDDDAYLSVPAAERVKSHIRYSALGPYGHEQHKHLLEIICLARQHGHQLFVAVAPAREDYRLEMADKSDFLGALKTLAAEQNVTVLDFFNGDHFGADDFGDTDHLKPLGAQKLTTALRLATPPLLSIVPHVLLQKLKDFRTGWTNLFRRAAV